MNRKSFLKLLVYPISVSFLYSCFRTPQQKLEDTFVPKNSPIKVSSISGNHLHDDVSFKERDVLLERGGSYFLINDNHEHEFEMSDNQMKTLRNGGRIFLVTQNSTDHEHNFTLEYKPSILDE